MANVKVVPRSLTDAYKVREGDFSPSLVGLQFTDPNAFFTFGNFSITTNLDSKITKNFALGGEWSDYYSLENLEITESVSQILLSNDINVRLNFDPYNISRYVYFGSFYEYSRQAIESIITKWKGSIYLTPVITNVPVNTVLSFNYNSGINKANFLIPESVISNPFQLNVTSTSVVNSQNEIYNIQTSYEKYVISNDLGEFKVIGYTGSTESYPYITVETEGNPFPSLTGTTFGQYTYHLKPNNLEVQLFFEELTDFENILLNRLTTPIYTASFDVPNEVDGFIYISTTNVTWPVSDGYNIDINTPQYATYVQALLGLSSQFDTYKTDLVSRRFVSESIHEYDTNGGGSEIYGMKVSKLLRIYGREFDEIKKYIDGISFANVVTYNKLDNTSDELIKILAKNLGFDVLLTVTSNEFNLLQQIQTTTDTPFEGYSRSLSAKELDVELWRRIVINAWWLFKSKGTRKVIEFFFNLFNIPQCMITLDEYIYLVADKINLDELTTTLQKLLGTTITSLSQYPVNNEGFPKIPTETDENYFQIGGFWYNGGNESTIGNNPHIGPYDYGQAYFNQFECFVPNFQSLKTATTVVTLTKNYFNKYNEGTFNPNENGLPISYYGKNYANVLNSNKLTTVKNAYVNLAGLTKLGDNNSPKYMKSNGDKYSMKINFVAGNNVLCKICENEVTFGTDGIVYIKGTVPKKPVDTLICCQNYWLPEKNNPGGKIATTTVEGAPVTSNYKCYWCPPSSYVELVCSLDDYISLFNNNPDSINTIAINLGWSPELYNVPPEIFLSNVLSNDFFKKYGCIYVTKPDNKLIKNKGCCDIQGGTWILEGSTNKNYCVKPPVNPCNYVAVINNVSQVFLTPSGDLVSKQCCSEKGGEWTNGKIKIYENTPQGQIITEITDVIGLSYSNNQEYCSNCPSNLEYFGDTGEYKNKNGSSLTQKCCEKYGFTYENGKCLKCPSNPLFIINFPESSNPEYVITNLDGLTPLEDPCCENYGGFYEDRDNTGLKCYQCGFISNEPNAPNKYDIRDDGQVVYLGKSLTKNCCDYYNNNIGGVVFNSVTNKCYIK